MLTAAVEPGFWSCTLVAYVGCSPQPPRSLDSPAVSKDIPKL